MENFQLPNLESLDITANDNLSGFISKLHWGNLPKSLSLFYTNFFREIPISIGNLRLLNELSISNCHFSGSLTSSPGSLSQLAYLDIIHSKFHQIPASFANLTQLSSQYLSNNNFNGGIGNWFVNLAKLAHLDLSSNSSTGSKVR